jgi:hypothetical protein
MFECGGSEAPADPLVVDAAVVDAPVVRAWRERLTTAASGSSAGLTDAERVDLLRALEELSCAAAGV